MNKVWFHLSEVPNYSIYQQKVEESYQRPASHLVWCKGKILEKIVMMRLLTTWMYLMPLTALIKKGLKWLFMCCIFYHNEGKATVYYANIPELGPREYQCCTYSLHLVVCGKGGPPCMVTEFWGDMGEVSSQVAVHCPFAHLLPQETHRIPQASKRWSENLLPILNCTTYLRYHPITADYLPTDKETVNYLKQWPF